MKCAICKQSETSPGSTTVTLERAQSTIVIKAVPAEVCDNCGEAYVDEATAARLLKTAEDAVRSGAQVEVRQYAA